MLRKSLAVLLLLYISLVCCQNYPKLGTLQGTYQVNEFKGTLHLCINGDVLQGSISQFGILNGQVTTDGKIANGTFFLAGQSNCDTLQFYITYTSEGFNGYYSCNRIKGMTFPLQARRESIARPTDDQCALLYTGTGSLEGKWTDTLLGTNELDVCFRETALQDPYTVHASYNTITKNSYYYPNQGFVAAYHFLGGKVAHGTWYEDFTGGSWLMFLNNRKELVVWGWTGLLGYHGATFIDVIQYNEPALHSVVMYSNPVATTNAQCDRNLNLNRFVLQNLQNVYPVNPNNFYYFLDSIISNPRYIHYQEVNSASTSSLLISAVIVLIHLLL